MFYMQLSLSWGQNLKYTKGSLYAKKIIIFCFICHGAWHSICRLRCKPNILYRMQGGILP